MTEPLPTFAIGVGQAGISMMNSLADIAERNNIDEKFSYVAVDTDGDALGSAPDEARHMRLRVSDSHLEKDRKEYPYLTDEMVISDKGAKRQRPVGRYKLDNHGHQSFNDYFRDLWDDIRNHYDNVDQTFEDRRDSFNIVLFHSISGGTGSGTFPLLSAVVNQIAKALENRASDREVYIAGVGVVPRVDFDPEYMIPPGNPMYYPNAYASLNDLSHLFNADENNLDIPLYSQGLSAGGQIKDDASATEVFDGNSIPIDREPYNDYFLLSVDEKLITEGGSDDIETYRQRINRRVGESIFALSQMSKSTENWSNRADSIPALGTIGHARLKVPHEEVEAFCDYQDERAEKRDFLENTFESRKDSLQVERDRLETIRDDPSNIKTYLDDGIDLGSSLTDRFERDLGNGNTLVMSNDAEDIERILDNLEEEFSRNEREDDPGPESVEDIQKNRAPEVLLLATDILDQMLSESTAAPAVKEHWEETVTNQWRAYNLPDRPKFGGGSNPRLPGKVTGLEHFYDEKVEEYEERVETIELGTVGEIQDKVPPYHPWLESEREAVESTLNGLRSDRDELKDADKRYQLVVEMEETVQEWRTRAKRLLDDKIHSVRDLITILEDRRETAESRVEELTRSIERAKDELSTERAGDRLGVLPIRRDQLDELNGNRIEELETLHDYVEQGFVDSEKIINGVERWTQRSVAWENEEFSMDFPEGTDQAPAQRQELWCLFHEDNKQYVDEGTDRLTIGGTTQKSSSEGLIRYIDDGYTLSFVSFFNDGPVEALDVYQNLEEMAEVGQLDTMAGDYQDYRQSFGYLEWYPPEIQNAFIVARTQEAPLPPELDPNRITKDRTDEELEQYIVRSGLNAYLWNGTMWGDYAFDPAEHETFEGWEDVLDITWQEFRSVTPEPDLKYAWLDGQKDWSDIIEGYIQNLKEQKKLDLTFDGS